MKTIKDINLKSSKILIIGMGRSGRAVLDYFLAQGIHPDLWDGADLKYDDEHFYKRVTELGLDIFFNNSSPNKDYDLVVISPGVSINSELILKLKRDGALIISELELAYEVGDCDFVGITGTNGKTTTTSLVGEIFKAAGFVTKVIGNIGEPAIKHIKDLKRGDVAVVEVSSFQLESSIAFRPHIAAILNITPDHLDRHSSMNNYIDEKMKIAIHQVADDFFIYNADDEHIVARLKDLSSQTLGFSSKQRLENGAYLENDSIFLVNNVKSYHLLDGKELKIKGRHNLENVMAAALMAVAWGIDVDIIRQAILGFGGVAHRLEFVISRDGVEFYNDSKGTNTDASIKAIEALDRDIILIAGGYDKQADFSAWLEFMRGRVKALVLMGATAKRIGVEAEKIEGLEIYNCEDMVGSVRVAKELAKKGDKVLLSPACASWDMYKCFEDRGDDFKSEVLDL